jgi:protein-disulfide isomerase
MRGVAVVVGLALALGAHLAAGSRAGAQDGWFPLRGDDGAEIANHRVPVELANEIERLPAIVTLGNPRGDVTLAEFYDLNCPYCREAAPEIADILRGDDELRLVLVAFPVLSVASIQASRVELALAGLGTPQQFYEFHHRIYAGRGIVDGDRALAVAQELGFDAKRLTDAANDDRIAETMKAHVRLGNALALGATPSFVLKGVAILGYPGRKALAAIIQSVRRCDSVVC